MADSNMLLNRAKSALLARDYQLAEKYYKTLISENPDELDYRIQLGNLYIKQGNDDEALNVFKGVERKNPENLTVLMAMAGIYRRKKMFDDSVAILEQALLISNNSPQDYATISYNLGFTYRQMGNNAEAIHCFENVIEQNPKDVLAYNHLGAIHALQGDHKKAISSYLQGLKFDSNHPILHFNIARSYAETGESQKALSHYEAALRAKPGWLDAIEEYANLLLKSNKVQEAEETVQNALKLNPDDVKMHTSMGNVYNRKSVFDNAELEFKKALDGDDEYTPALTGLAHSLEKQGRHEEAAETISKAQRLNPDDVSVIKQSAQVLLSANFLSAAYEKISRLWEINSKDPQTVSLLGQYYIAKGDDAKVESCFDKIQEIAPDYKDVYKDWGARYVQKGDNKKAKQYLKTAINQNSKDSESMMYLGEIYETEDRPEDALAMYKMARHADVYNDLSKKEISKLQDEGIVGSKNIDFPDDVSPLQVKNVISQDTKSNKVPDLLNDTTNPLNSAFEDFDSSNTQEIQLKSDDDLTEQKSSDTPDEEKVPDEPAAAESEEEKETPAVDEEFDFDQFGMEKLKEENPEEISLASLDDMMQEDDIQKNENPRDIDELIDDGIPFDEDDEPDMQFIPDSSDFLNSNAENSPSSDSLLEDADTEPALLAEDDEDEEIPDILDSADWKADEEPKAQNENLADKINGLEDQVKASSKMAEEAKNSAERIMEAMQKNTEQIPEEVEEEPMIEESITDENLEDERVFENGERVSETEELAAAEKKAEELSPEELMMKRAIDMIPEIVSGIEDRTTFYKFKRYLEMFKTLRNMLDFLPEIKQQEFMSSRNRLLLDYVISKLSGEPGLYATAKALHTSGIIHDNPALKGSDSEGIELVKEVLKIMLRLSESLEDEALRIAVEREAKELLKKL